MSQFHYYLDEADTMSSRYMCDVIEDMRKMYATHNYSGLLGSIEQMQTMAYRMEAALGDKRTLEEYESQAASLNHSLKITRKEQKALEAEIKVLKDERDTLKTKVKDIKHFLKRETKGGTVGPCCNRNADMMSCNCPKDE